MRLFIIGTDVVNTDNDGDAQALLAQGARELTTEEISSAGLTGYEHLVGPSNTEVAEDGGIIFSPPVTATLEEIKAAKLNEITANSDLLFHQKTATVATAELMAAYWLKCEADAWLTGAEASVPLLKKASAASGLPVNDLARIITANYEKMADYFGAAIGLKLASELQIQGAQAISDVEKITFNSRRS